jgi:ribosomal protein L29
MNHLETKLVASLNKDIEELKLSELNARVKALTTQLALNPAAVK